MTEEFLYYIWQFKLFQNPLNTLDGQSVYIEKPGNQNLNSGPDFLNASIKIGDVIWHGNVEIHVRTSDWYLHGHDGDANYQNLILHIVYIHDVDNLPHDCPMVVLENQIANNYIVNYTTLKQSKSFIPCEASFMEVDEGIKFTFLEVLFIERLERRILALDQRLKILHGNWEALLFEQISRSFGLRINADAFEMLSKSFPFKTLQSVKRKNENIEALLFGQGGYLDEPLDEFQQSLATDYLFIQHKYTLRPMQNHLFKLLRLRPSNFPTIRISQLASLYQQEFNIFSKVIAAKTIMDFMQILNKVKASSYWDSHYVFGKNAKNTKSKKLSLERKQLMILNVMIPIQYLYARHYGQNSIEDILQLVRNITPEQNTILKKYKKIGARIDNAHDSQAYLELNKYYCKPKKCLNCRIGNKIMYNVR